MGLSRFLSLALLLLAPIFGENPRLLFGEDAPEFRLYDQEGYVHSLIQHRGQFVLLFFYPRDFTYFSVKAISAFEQAYQALKKKNVVIYGISNDKQNTHLLFHEKFQLTYDLLADPEEEVIKQYEAKGFIVSRFVSYLIGPDGRIFRKYEGGSPLLHPSLVLNDLPDDL